MSDDDMSDKDMEVENVEEGANVRVVQSSMHASIMQNSLFKVVENKKESENNSGDEDNKEEENKEVPAIEPKIDSPKELVIQTEEVKPEEDKNPKEEIKIEKNESDEKKAEDEKSLGKTQSKAVKSVISAHLQEIFNEKTKKPKSAKLDVEKRFYEYKDKVTKKIEALKEEQKAKEAEICSFKPKTTIKNSEDRKFSHFLHHMETVDKLKKENLDKRVTEKEEAENPDKKSFKPTLSKGTLKIIGKNKSVGDLHEKLYKESTELKKKKEENSQKILDNFCPFKPVVSKKSSDLAREGKISQRLFEEATSLKNAKEKAKSETISDKKPEKLISDHSQSIVREKFLKEVSQFIPAKEGDSEQGLEFKDFLTLLEKLHFIHANADYNKYTEERELSNKAWTSIGGAEDSKLLISAINGLLLSIMNLSKSIPQSKAKPSQEYKILYENRKNKTEEKQPMPVVKSYTFKPSLNSVTEEMAKIIKSKRSAEFNETRPEKVLEMIEKSAKEKLEKRRNNEQSELPTDCTFKPKTKRGPRMDGEVFTENASLASDYLKLSSERKEHRTELLYNFSKLEQERKERLARTVEDIDIEQNMAECTFTPCLEKGRKKWEIPEPKMSTGDFDVSQSNKPLRTYNDSKQRNDWKKSIVNSEKVHENQMDEEEAIKNQRIESARKLMKMDTLRSYCPDDHDTNQEILAINE